MAIEFIACENCTNKKFQIDTTREFNDCPYCGTTIRTKKVLHLDAESTKAEKLKSNAQRSFDVREYDDARAAWETVVTQLNQTDYESYWGLVRCIMAAQPDDLISEKDTPYYKKALAYATDMPLGVKEDYKRQVDTHNAKIRTMRATREAKARADQRAHNIEICKVEREIKWLYRRQKCLNIAPYPLIVLILLLIISSGINAEDFPFFGVILFGALAIFAMIRQRTITKRITESENRLEKLENPFAYLFSPGF